MTTEESYEVQICSPHQCILRNEQMGWRKGFHTLAEAIRFIQQLPGGIRAALTVLDAQRHHLMRLNSLAFAVRTTDGGQRSIPSREFSSARAM